MRPGASQIALSSLANAADERVGDRASLQQALLEAFAALRAPVYRYFLSSAGNRLDAEDLTQETFLHLVRAVRRGDTPDNLRAWLFHVAHNLLVDWQRGCRRTPLHEDVSEVEVIDAMQGTEEAVACRQRLEQFLACLTAAERRCMELRLEGLRYREIAAALEIRVPTVQTLLTRAARKLAKQTNEQP
ncbi:MAG TPA: sigma-70 family RNA polymerase sigma factor [Bryobacteraceae bacterium]|nr:sigma-70 family RNA polymerase sigma factor [Bryobacteraceae bacterium]